MKKKEKQLKEWLDYVAAVREYANAVRKWAKLVYSDGPAALDDTNPPTPPPPPPKNN